MSVLAQAEDNKIKVFAAASLTDVMNVLVKQYGQQTGVQVVPVYGGSGTLAKQLEQGAPGDLFISADEKWMQYLKDKQLVQVPTIKPWLGNRLVMITPQNKPLTIKADANVDVNQQAPGYWCTGDTLSVPVGIYAKQSLTALGWWDKLKTRLVSTQDVRATLSLVERDECDVGIVYASDAQSSSKVKVAGEFAEIVMCRLFTRWRCCRRRRQRRGLFIVTCNPQRLKSCYSPTASNPCLTINLPIAVNAYVDVVSR